MPVMGQENLFNYLSGELVVNICHYWTATHRFSLAGELNNIMYIICYHVPLKAEKQDYFAMAYITCLACFMPRQLHKMASLAGPR